jgi:hypothetical protein
MFNLRIGRALFLVTPLWLMGKYNARGLCSKRAKLMIGRDCSMSSSTTTGRAVTPGWWDDEQDVVSSIEDDIAIGAMLVKDKWRMVSLLGRWHQVAFKDGKCYKAFRFYSRENQHGERVWFADYRIGDLSSRHHRVGVYGEGVEVCWKRVNTKVLDMTREDLAVLED